MEMNNDKTQDWIKPATKSDQEESLTEKEENLYNRVQLTFFVTTSSRGPPIFRLLV